MRIVVGIIPIPLTNQKNTFDKFHFFCFNILPYPLNGLMEQKNGNNSAPPSQNNPTKPMSDVIRDIGSIKLNFENSPTDIDHAKNLIDLCFETRVAITHFADQSKVDQALSVPEISSYVRRRLDQNMKIAYKTSWATGKTADIKIDLELAESLASLNKDPDPEILNLLFCYNALIQRHWEAMNYLLSAAQKDLVTYGPSYIEFCFKLEKEVWYKKAVEFYESHKEALDPLLDDHKKAMVAYAYDRIAGIQSEGFTKTFPAFPEGTNHYIQIKELLAKAHAIHRDIYDRILKQINEGQPLTEENAPHLTNYAVNLYQLAMLSDHNSHIEPPPLGHLRLSHRSESAQILEDLVRRIDQLPSPSEKLLNKQKIAKAEMVCASASEGMGAEANEKAISIATGLKNDPEIQEIGRYSNFLNAYGVHLGIRRRRLETGDFSEEEKILTEALMADWKNHRIYLSLSNFYEQKGDEEASKRFRVFRHLIQAWEHMRQALDAEMGIVPEEGSAGKKMSDELILRTPAARFDKILKAFLNEATGYGATAEKIFRPLNRSMRLYSKKVKKWIRSIAPENCIVIARLKSPYSILLKMLKEGKDSVTEITNLLTFKIETETVEDAKQLCEQIEKRMTVVKRRNRLDEQGSADLKFMDFTGHLNGDPFMFLVQVRPKEVESSIEKSKANYENYKLNYIKNLDAEISKDPQKHLQSFHDILVKLGRAHLCFSQAKRGISSAEVLKIYQDPDQFEPEKK